MEGGREGKGRGRGDREERDTEIAMMEDGGGRRRIEGERWRGRGEDREERETEVATMEEGACCQARSSSLLPEEQSRSSILLKNGGLGINSHPLLIPSLWKVRSRIPKNCKFLSWNSVIKKIVPVEFIEKK
jgi:hypothetical protein